MRRSLFAVLVVVGCAQAGVVPRDGSPAAPPHPGGFQWSYPEGSGSAEEVRRPMGLYHPNPRVEQLVRARRLTADGAETIEGAVRFCVGVDGKTKDLATAAPTGEAKLDEVLRATVGAWRFKPAQRGSQPVEACSTAIFAMSFE